MSSRKRDLLEMKNVKYYVEESNKLVDDEFSTEDEAINRLWVILECESNYNYKINSTNSYSISKYDETSDRWTTSRPVTVGEWRWLEAAEKQALIRDIRLELM